MYSGSLNKINSQQFLLRREITRLNLWWALNNATIKWPNFLFIIVNGTSLVMHNNEYSNFLLTPKEETFKVFRKILQDTKSVDSRGC